MKVECKAACEWIEPEVSSKYTAKISCQTDCKLNQRELGFGQLNSKDKAEESLMAYLNSHCPVLNLLSAR